MRKTLTLAVILGLVLAVGCTTTQKGAGVGTLIGAGAGAIIGHQSDHTEEGALIGAAVGAAGGALVGDMMEVKYCPTCGAGYTEGYQNCPVDGTALRRKGQAAATQEEDASALPMFCPECGASYAEGSLYCPVDGTELKPKR